MLRNNAILVYVQRWTSVGKYWGRLLAGPSMIVAIATVLQGGVESFVFSGLMTPRGRDPDKARGTQ
jgi:hypothetical protein